MKSILILLPLLAVAIAAPASSGSESDAAILKYDSDNIGVDGYTFEFDTSNGLNRQESGKLLNAGSENEALEVNGAFSNPVGDKKITVTFVAGPGGYYPKYVVSN